VDTDLAELSSISSSLGQLSRRLAALAEGAQRERREDVAAELFSVERSVASAERKLSRMIDKGR
jgi:hypothetical protein